MKKKINKIACRFAIPIAIICLCATAWADDDFPLHGRISYEHGDTLIKGKDDEDWSNATLNTLVLTGDVLWTDEEGCSEIEFPNAVFLRMADRTKVVVSQISPELVLKGIVGSFYIVRLARSTGAVCFTTSACRLTFDPNTCTRIDIDEKGSVRISTRWGKAYVTTDYGKGSVVVGDGQRCWVETGYLPSDVVSFTTSDDDEFDRWNRERHGLMTKAIETTPKYINVTERTIGYADLSDSGEWVLIKERYYWRPTVVTVEYVPYRCGYWTFVPAIGSVWIETYPFGYITTHYGRWVYFESHGWVWGFDPVWAPAWVASVRCGDYFVWTPVDFDCRPVRVSASVSFAVGGLNFYVGACSYVPATYVYTAPVYVAPVAPPIVDYIVANPVNIHIWNIEAHPRRRVVAVPFPVPVPVVRDYAPPRVIRGLGVCRRDMNLTPAQRIAELDRLYLPRTPLPTLTPLDHIRPTPLPQDRISPVRSVRLNNLNPRTAPSFFTGHALRKGEGVRSEQPPVVEQLKQRLSPNFTEARERTFRAGSDNLLRNEARPTAPRTQLVRETPETHRGPMDVHRQREVQRTPGNESPRRFDTPRLDMDGERRPGMRDGGSRLGPRSPVQRDSDSDRGRDNDSSPNRGGPTPIPRGGGSDGDRNYHRPFSPTRQSFEPPIRKSEMPSPPIRDPQQHAELHPQDIDRSPVPLTNRENHENIRRDPLNDVETRVPRSQEQGSHRFQPGLTRPAPMPHVNMPDFTPGPNRNPLDNPGIMRRESVSPRLPQMPLGGSGMTRTPGGGIPKMQSDDLPGFSRGAPPLDLSDRDAVRPGFDRPGRSGGFSSPGPRESVRSPIMRRSFR